MSIPSQIAAESFVARGLRCGFHLDQRCAHRQTLVAGVRHLQVDLGADFELHINGGRDRDRFVQRSMLFVVLDEVDRLRLGRAG